MGVLLPTMFSRATIWTSLVLLCGCIGYRTPLGDTGDGKGTSAGVACTPGTVLLTQAKPTVMFVIDRSTSMERSMGNTSDSRSRWQVLESALLTVLPSVDSSMEIGALIFPAGPPETAFCSVPSAADLLPATGNLAALTTLMEAGSPNGSTPTAAAIDAAAKTLLTLQASATGRVMVLATDGAPNYNTSLSATTCRCAESAPPGDCIADTACLDDARTIQAISKCASQGLPTYIIAIQPLGSNEFTDVLDAMAVAGRRARSGLAQKYYAASSEGDLNSALTAIRDEVGSCTYLSSSVPGSTGSIVLAANDTDLSPDNWMWGDRRDGEIVLLGDVCKAMITADPPRITATVECN